MHTCSICGDNYKDTYTPKLIVNGDADGDGDATLVDVMLIQQYIAGWGVNINHLKCDIDGDSEVTLIDVMITLQIIAGWNV